MAKKIKASPRVRLDSLLVERGLVASRERGRRLLMAGAVLVNGRLADKPGALVLADSEIEIKAQPRFVSRGGDKLEAAFVQFDLEVAGKACADVGASIGGFTDCLLRRGAARVYALDVGSGLLDWRLRNDPRVVVMEDTNARYVERLPEPIQFAVVDASFISLKILLPVIRNWLAPVGEIVALIKPQFEAGRDRVGRKGVVRDANVHREVLREVLTFARSINLAAAGLMRSPLTGPAGNAEFLAWLTTKTTDAAMELLIDRALTGGAGQ